MTNNQQQLKAILRNDLFSFTRRVFASLNPGTPFLENWHLEAICHVLTQCYLGNIKRLIITIPPRQGKSICASVALPAFILGHDPTQRIIATSYGATLATELSNHTRQIMKESWYRIVFPGSAIDPAKDSADFFRTTQNGHRLATSVGGAITGFGGNWLIIDDPMKATALPSENDLLAVQDYYTGTLYSRLDNKKDGRIILIQQRVHENDLAGYLLEQEGWYHLNLPAIAEEAQCIPLGEGREHYRQPGEALHPEREPLEELKRTEAQMGPYAFAAQYQQRPAPIGGGIIKWEWFRHYDDLPDDGKGGYVVQSWDTALSIEEGRSYSVCTTWWCANNRYYLVDVWRQRLEFHALVKFVPIHAQAHHADLVLIEQNNCSIPLIETLLRHSTLTLMTVQPKGSKAERMVGETAALANGSVQLPNKADWLDTFRNEVLQFPASKHDDQVDSLSQFLMWARMRGPSYPGGIRGQGLPDDGSASAGFSRVTIIQSDPGPLNLSELF